MLKRNLLGAFTIVELIVVITILAILGTIAFVSFGGLTISARDTTRLTDVRVIEKGLSLYKVKENILPRPDEAITLTASGTTIGYQGYVGVGVLRTISQAGEIKDPLDSGNYTFVTDNIGGKYQILSMMEEGENPSLTFTGDIYASNIDYSNRYPKTFGYSLGVLVDENTTPIEKLGTIFSLDIINYTGNDLTSYLNDNITISGNGKYLREIIPHSSCKKLLAEGNIQSGIYTISPFGSTGIEVYCDMETDGGGWTFTTFISENGTGLDLFIGAATEPYDSNRGNPGQSYGIDTTQIAHKEFFLVRSMPNVTKELLDNREVIQFTTGNYFLPMFNMPYMSKPSFKFRFSFSGEYLTNPWLYKRNTSQYHQICVRKYSYQGNLPMCVQITRGFTYPNEYSRSDEKLYTNTHGSTSGTSIEDVWMYVR